MRFALVGAAATALYAAIAWTGAERLGLPSPLASLAAYALAMLFSYAGHRTLTFASPRRHREAAPRFAGIALCGYVVALAAPWLLTESLGAPSYAGILVTCVLVPTISYMSLARVFGSGGDADLARS